MYNVHCMVVVVVKQQIQKLTGFMFSVLCDHSIRVSESYKLTQTVVDYVFQPTTASYAPTLAPLAT